MPDARVQAAIANWAPRFTSQGVDYNDFVRTTGKIKTWDEWLPAWVETGDMHAELAKEAEAAGRELSAGEAWVRAALSYHFAKFVWMVNMDAYRKAADKAVASLYAAHKHLDPTAERIEIPFEGSTLVGNFRRPPGLAKPPVVLLLPGLDSTKEEFFNWENVFLKRGIATLSLDGPGQGESGYNLHIRPDYNVAATAAIDALSTRTDIDLNRIGLAGVSLGGYYAPRAAAFEKRIKVAAAIGGGYDFGIIWDDLPMLTRETFIHHTGSANAEEALPKVQKISLAGVAELVDQPLLIVFGKKDRLIPWQQAIQLADEAQNATLAMYEEGNHVCNNIPFKYRPLVGDWIREQLADV